MKASWIHIAVFYQLFLSAGITGQKTQLNLKNQVSGWATAGFSDPFSYQFGMRYIPTLSIADSLGKNRILDMEVSGNMWANALFAGKNYENGNASITPYRLWIRYATPRIEFRIGLQKINFGSATILRPLMWFDKMDFRDPLQLTDGVYAFLSRYYFHNNANIWFWTLYGNEETKGWEAVPTQKRIPEAGGRFQFLTPRGEAAITYHFRRAEFMPPSDTLPESYFAQYPENRIGIDGRWDIGVGLWFEYVVKYNDMAHEVIPKWETYLNLGTDYTFPIGNGLNMTAEYFRYGAGAEFTGERQHNNFLVVAANYPLGILNNISAVVYYSPDLQDWYRIISLQRRYDYWSFYLMTFWNPDRFALYKAENGRNLFAGKGLQFMAVVNL